MALLPKTATLTKPAPRKARNITRKEIEEYLATCEHARALESQARNLRKLAGVLEGEIKEYIDAHKSGPVRSVDRSGYRLSIELVPGNVAWMPAFVRACGEAEAQRLRDEAEQKEKLKIQALRANDKQPTSPPAAAA
jgi:hypothetical protein